MAHKNLSTNLIKIRIKSIQKHIITNFFIYLAVLKKDIQSEFIDLKYMIYIRDNCEDIYAKIARKF
ncbi:hypothetical protein BpHYR1_031986 [Brachionus plicatilis]|uniref:Uncharacterized protein n=1 Tax=Brachionus plicatilis TaxID=10195 RepID=A0A3M7SCI0_BRAPC|nr:hypothetical protein BpHYR1_031986 [Brachionus plicatilis]